MDVGERRLTAAALGVALWPRRAGSEAGSRSAVSVLRLFSPSSDLESWNDGAEAHCPLEIRVQGTMLLRAGVCVVIRKDPDLGNTVAHSKMPPEQARRKKGRVCRSGGISRTV